MSEESPEFTLVRYHTYGVEGAGTLLPRPPEAKHLDLLSLENSFIHVFGEVADGGFETVGVYQAVVEAGGQQTLRFQAVVGTDASGGFTFSPSVSGLRLPTTVSGGTTDRKYFFIALPYVLQQATEIKLKQGAPSPIPVVSLLSTGKHFRFFDPAAKAYLDAATSGTVRVLFIIDPVHAGTMLARELEVLCNKVVGFTKPEVHKSGSKEEKDTKERMMKLRLAKELDLLRQMKPGLNGKLAEGGSTLDQFLRDLDPTDEQGKLGRRIKERDDFSFGVIKLAESDLWNLLEEDARDTDDHALVAYPHLLNTTCQMFERSAECPLFAEFWLKIAVDYPLVDSGLARKEPSNGIENIAERFIFSDKLTPQENWKQPVAVETARNLFPMFVAISKTLADLSDGNLGDGVQGPDASPQLEPFAKGQINTKAGRAAYRWVYHLRSNLLLEQVEIVGIERVVTWRDTGGTIEIKPTELFIDIETAEFQKFTTKGLVIGHVGIASSVVGLIYSGLSLRHSIEAKAATDLDILKTGAAALSLVGDDFVITLLARSDTLFNSTTAIKAMKWAGLFGAAIGTIAGFIEAKRTWTDTGEVDVALVQGVGAAAGAIAIWGSASALGIFTFAGPPGWLILAGLAIAVAAPIAASLLQDSAIEDMFEHCAFGEDPGEADNAPGLALCEGGKFSFWAGETVTSLERQLRGFSNAIWIFSCKGVCTTAADLFGNFPRVELSPQRTLDNSAFEIEVSMVWGNGAAQVALDGKVRVHFGSNVRIQQISGTPFGGGGVRSPAGDIVGVLFKSKTTTNGSERRAVDWIIAPASPTDRARVQGLPLTTATLRMKLIGDVTANPALAFPLDEPGKPPKVFSYELAQTLKQGKTQARLVLKTDEVVSTTVY